MNRQMMQQLLALARSETGPAGSADFAAEVVRAVRREPTPERRRSAGLFEQLSGWCPRLAVTAVAVILFCAVADEVADRVLATDGPDAAAQFSSAYLTDGEMQ